MNWQQTAGRLALRFPRLKRMLENAVRQDNCRNRDPNVTSIGKSSGVSILDAYVKEFPTPERGLKIFDGEWSSYIPGFGCGQVHLFDDDRIKWLEQQLNGFKNKKILELGPLEAGHTYMMSQAGATSVTAIESNMRAFLKCLVVQNLFKIKASFLLGDFQSYLAACDEKYDFVLASGVLYHMNDPVKLLDGIAKITNSFGLWTHYYDHDAILSQPHLKIKFDVEPHIQSVGSRHVISHKQSYLDALGWEGFCGGSAPSSEWLTRDSLLGVIEDLGFRIEVGDETMTHPNGPAILLFASR